MEIGSVGVKENKQTCSDVIFCLKKFTCNTCLPNQKKKKVKFSEIQGMFVSSMMKRDWKLKSFKSCKIKKQQKNDDD